MEDIEFEKLMLSQKQSLPLEQKINIAERRIEQFYEVMEGNVYVSFSGGKDSTVLLNLVRSLYPDVPAVFVDTGLEFPEVREFVKTIPNVIWIKPEIPFIKVLSEFGYPVVSKLVSTQVRVLRNPTENNKLTTSIYLNGYDNEKGQNTQFKFANKWKFLLDAPFKISEKCCREMKHHPFAKFQKETGLSPYIGTMASDSLQRTINYTKTHCNSFNGKTGISRPISIWIEKDIWKYIEKNNIKYSKIYDMGWERTGCAFCMFGCHMEKDNRFERMKITHPQLYKYCMEKLGLKEKIEYIRYGLYGKPRKSLFDF